MWVGQCRHIPDHTVPQPIAAFPDDTVAPLNLHKESVQMEFKSHGVEKDGYRMITKLWGAFPVQEFLITMKQAVRG